MRLFLMSLTALFALTACGDLPGAEVNADPNQEEEVEPEPRDYMGPIGGDRPVEADFPDDYDVMGNHPLLIQLHGLGSNAAETVAGFQTAADARERGVVVLTPEGTDSSQGQFWNATNRCCDLDQTGVDDVAYLSGLVEEAVERYAVDPERVFFMGISNGGFMSHRMACDHGDLVRGIVSFNGSSFDDPEDCAPEDPVQIIHVHGTDDNTVGYEDNFLFPGARTVVDRWVGWNECDPDSIEGPQVNVTAAVEGDETTIETWENCREGGEVELWTMEGAGHVPIPLADFSQLMFDALLPETR